MNETIKRSSVEWSNKVENRNSDKASRLFFLGLYVSVIISSLALYGGVNEDGTPKSTGQLVLTSLLAIYAAYKVFTTIFRESIYTGNTFMSDAGIKTRQHRCENIFSSFERQEIDIPWADVQDARFDWITITDSAVPGLVITMKDGASPWSQTLMNFYDTEQLAKADLAVIESLRKASSIGPGLASTIEPIVAAS